MFNNGILSSQEFLFTFCLRSSFNGFGVINGKKCRYVYAVFTICLKSSMYFHITHHVFQ